MNGNFDFDYWVNRLKDEYEKQRTTEKKGELNSFMNDGVTQESVERIIMRVKAIQERLDMAINEIDELSGISKNEKAAINNLFSKEYNELESFRLQMEYRDAELEMKRIESEFNMLNK